jgi:ABC-type phosphate transport system substrate-binding protein
MFKREVFLMIVFVQAVATLCVCALGTPLQAIIQLGGAVTLQALNRRYNAPIKFGR